MAVLLGRAVPSASPVAFRALSEALCSLVRTEGLPSGPELVPFQPALARLVPDGATAGDGTSTTRCWCLPRASCASSAASPATDGCLVVLEDLHWADPETLTIVEYLADNLSPSTCLSRHRARRGTDARARPGPRSAVPRSVGPDSNCAARPTTTWPEMLDSCLDGPAVPEAARPGRVADGVPFLVEELLASAVASGALVHHGGSWTLCSGRPRRADHLRRQRSPTASLRSATRPDGLLAAAAVLGRRFDWELLPRSRASTRMRS